MTRVDEVVLRTLVIQFDGRVVEVFGSQNDSARRHVALMKEPEVRAPNRKGRSTVKVAGVLFDVDADELLGLRPLLDKIDEAVRIAKDQTLG
jgi:hypothetical protein